MSGTDPMTEKQATLLRRLCVDHGVEFDSELTKWEASDYIKELQDEMPPEKRAVHPSYKQIHATPCPECGAGKWSKCREDGSTRPQFHQARQSAARRAAIEWRKAQDDRADAGDV
jgi:hypothetical protein